MSRLRLIRLAGILTILVSSGGCPSGGDNHGDSASVLQEPPAHPAVEPGPIPIEPVPSVIEPGPVVGERGPLVEQPAPLSEHPTAQQLIADDPPDAQPDTSATEPGPDQTVNPLRFGNPIPDVERPPLEPVIIDPPAEPAAIHARIGAEHDDQPFDPIGVNGPIFEDWPKPKVALVITGRHKGYIEPCGCAGLDRMKGGMSRRHTFFQELREKGWPVVGIDVGGIARGYGRQAEMKFHTMADGMRTMGFDAITLGKSDLLLQTGELLVDAAGGQESPFLSANVALFGFDAKLTARFRVIERAGIKFGITGVLGRKFQKQIHNQEIEIRDPQTALGQVLPELKQRAEFLILLAHADTEEAIELAKKFPEFKLVVTAGGGDEPPNEYTMVNDGNTILVEVGEKGMHAVVLGIFDDPQQRFRYQRVPLDSRFRASPAMQRLMEGYQDQLQAAGFAGLGLRPTLADPRAEVGGEFVGSQKCKKCHEDSYRVWKKSGHAKAFKTLLDLKPPRQYDPECVSCHVIGWHPSEYFPYKGGYASQESTPQLVNVGCETCHGPCGAHVKAEGGSDLKLQEKMAAATVITKEEAADPLSPKQNCRTCHDGDNDPDFDFETYWPHVEHKEE